MSNAKNGGVRIAVVNSKVGSPCSEQYAPIPNLSFSKTDRIFLGSQARYLPHAVWATLNGCLLLFRAPLTFRCPRLLTYSANFGAWRCKAFDALQEPSHARNHSSIVMIGISHGAILAEFHVAHVAITDKRFQ